MGNPKVTCGEAPREFGVSRKTMGRALKEDFGPNGLRRLAAKRAKPVNTEKRLAICRKRQAQIAYGELGPMAIYWADGELFRLGACPGNSQNAAIWVKRERVGDGGHPKRSHPEGRRAVARRFLRDGLVGPKLEGEREA